MDQEYNINSSIIRGRGHIQFNLLRLILNTINEVDNTTINESINQTNLEKPVIADFLKNLKKKIISNEMISEDLECAICLEKFKLNEKCIQLPCNDRPHFFHCDPNENCQGIIPWLQKNNTCPVCRSEFPTEPSSVTRSEPGPSSAMGTESEPSSVTESESEYEPSQRSESGPEYNINQGDFMNSIDACLRRINFEIIQGEFGINTEEVDIDLQYALELSTRDY